MQKSSVSRRNFVTSSVLGVAGILCGPQLALASTSSSEAPRLNLQVDLTPSEGSSATDACQARVVKNLSQFDGVGLEGNSEIVVEVVPPSSSQSAGARTTTSGGYSDPVAEISVNATWTMSTNHLKVNLTKVVVKFTQKGGSISNRGIFIRNNDLIHKKDPAPLSYTYSPTWGFLPYYSGNESSVHFINVWGKATPSGMSSTTDISCMVTYGSPF